MVVFTYRCVYVQNKPRSPTLQADADAAKEFGMAAPMGARMMSGQTKYHEHLERRFVKPSGPGI